MIGTIANVVRGERLASAMRRANERIAAASRDALLRARGIITRSHGAAILNIAPGGIAPRTGGVAVQLAARLAEERELRNVALFHRERLTLSAPASHIRRVTTIDDALALTRAAALHIEGTGGMELDEILHWTSRMPVTISVHDFSLFCETGNLLEHSVDRFCGYSRDPLRCARCTPHQDAVRHRDLARRVLTSAAGLVFASQFLLDAHRELFNLPLRDALVIEPPTPALPAHTRGDAIAFAGSVGVHKGAHLLPEIATALAARNWPLHVFGGGDLALLRALRAHRNVVVHGYYRAGTLPSLLARHGVGHVLLPSIVPESFSLTLSETWLAGATAIAFDHGAPAHRIREHGGGRLVPLDAGVAGIIDAIDAALRAPRTDDDARRRALTSPAAAARAFANAYRAWGLIAPQ